MSVTPNDPSVPDDPSDAAAEFAGMSRKLALVVAAQEGFATRLQEMHGRDYSDDLAKIQQGLRIPMMPPIYSEMIPPIIPG